MKRNLKIKKQSAADLVCEQMKEFILDGTWPLYQKIPSESELSEAFGVNRLTVRIALQKLNVLGVLDTRVGDGTYVCSFNFDSHMGEISDFYMTPEILDDVQEYRQIIQLECARLAVERGTGEELALLKNWVEKFAEEVERYHTLNDPQAQNESFTLTVDYALEFQSQLCRMSHNELLSFSYAVAKEPIRRHMLRNAAIRIQGEQAQTAVWVEAFRNVCAAIEAKDLQRCRQYLLQIITGSAALAERV